MSQHDTLTQALQEAAASLETISRDAGKVDTLESMYQVRPYAANRARAAREALATHPAQAQQAGEVVAYITTAADGQIIDRLGLAATHPGRSENTRSRGHRSGRFETEQAEGLRRATMNKQLAQQLWDANARIESMIHIGGMATDCYSLPDVIDDLLQEDDETLAHAFPDMPEWVKEALDDRHERGPAFSEWVHQDGKLGFVVQFATPVMRNVDEHGGGTYSWGHYYTRWVYGETLEEAASKALAWVAERREHERKKERAEAVGA